MNDDHYKTTTIIWAAAPEHPVLSKDAVHLWLGDFGSFPSLEIEQKLQILSADEIRKSQRFRFTKDRYNYINARSWLRTIIGNYLRIDPALLRFGYSEQGKPWLMNEAGNPHSLQFNLSHSESVAICALAWNKAVGIDMEAIRNEESYHKIAENFFSENERFALRSIAPPLQQAAFFNGWTRKEAYLKARGDGLTSPLDQFEVSLNTENPELISVNNFPQENQRWTLYHLNPKPRYIGALAVEGKLHKLSFFTTPESFNSTIQLDNSALLL